MKERDLERRFVLGIESVGGLAYKFTAPHRRSVPDRVVMVPGLGVFFAEMKGPGGTLTFLQRQCHERMRNAGATVYALRSPQEVDEFIESLRRGVLP